jgi:hypothetical protein
MSDLDREVIAALADYVATSQKVIGSLLGEKGDVAGHEFHGNRFTGGLGGGSITSLAGRIAMRNGVEAHVSYMNDQDHTGVALEMLRKTGGFTYDAVTHTFMNIGDKGFAVSPYKGRERVFDQPIIRMDLMQYIRDNADLLGQPGHAVGGWDDENGHQVLDVSVIAPTKDEALTLARANNQDAIFDFRAGQSIAAKDAPVGDEKYAEDQPRDWHGRFGAGAGMEGSGSLPFNPKGDQYFHALNAKGQAYVASQSAKYKVSIESYTKEILGRLRTSDGKPNAELLARGAKWYPMAHELTGKIAESTKDMPHPLPQEVVATAMARMSPQTAWETNAEVTARLSQFVASGKADGMDGDKAALAFKAEWKENGWGGESITHPGTNNGLAMMNNLVSDAVDALTGAKSIEESLQSVKQRSFANDIMLPGQTRDVTVDIMMQKGLTFACSGQLPKDDDQAKELGLKPDSISSKGVEHYLTMNNLFTENGGEKTGGCKAGAGYVIAAGGTRVAADELGVSPDVVQAAYWLVVQDETPSGWPRSTGATMTQIKMPLVNELLGHPFIGTAEYDVNAPYAKAATIEFKSASVFPLKVDYGTMGLDDVELMTEDEYEQAVEEGKDFTIDDRKYSDDELRDDHGRWTAGGESGESGPTKVETMEDAVRLLGQGKGIMFQRPEQAVTLLHELSRIANDAKAKGEKAPTYDLCKVSVADTNLFCSQNVGIPRSAMPQLIGKPTPGSPADSLSKNAKGEVDLGPAFRDYLGAQGHVIEDTNEYADRLRASQTEMDGTKVGGMMEAIQAGKIPPSAIFVSDDNYVIDGHHRWAATVGVQYGDNSEEKLQMPVARIDMKILPALAAANDFATMMGIPQSGITKAFFAVLDIKMWLDAKAIEQHGFPEMEGKALSDAEKADFGRETDRIRENVAKPENQKPHQFEAAHWTHPNGHPRCIRCGEEESTDGMCRGDMVPTGEDARDGSRPADKSFETRVQFKLAEIKGDASGLIKWFEDGADGQITWGSPGDFDDCVTVASKHMDEDQAKGFCNLRHQGATGAPPGKE